MPALVVWHLGYAFSVLSDKAVLAFTISGVMGMSRNHGNVVI